MNLSDLRRICDEAKADPGLFSLKMVKFRDALTPELVGLLLDCAEAGAAVHFGTSYHYDATCGCDTCMGMSLAQDRLDAYLKEQA